MFWPISKCWHLLKSPAPQIGPLALVPSSFLRGLVYNPSPTWTPVINMQHQVAPPPQLNTQDLWEAGTDSPSWSGFWVSSCTDLRRRHSWLSEETEDNLCLLVPKCLHFLKGTFEMVPNVLRAKLTLSLLYLLGLKKYYFFSLFCKCDDKTRRDAQRAQSLSHLFFHPDTGLDWKTSVSCINHWSLFLPNCTNFTHIWPSVPFHTGCGAHVHRMQWKWWHGGGWTESPLDAWVTRPGYLIQWKGLRLNLCFPPLHTLLPFNVVSFRRRPSGFIANAIIKCITHEHGYCVHWALRLCERERETWVDFI